MAYNNDNGNYRSGYYTGGVGAYTDQWGNPMYASIDEECPTVIVDADGIKRTVIGWTPLHKPEGYVTKTETIIEERVHSPLLPSYRQSSYPSVVEPVRGYGYGADNAWQRRSSSPVRGGYGYADQASRIVPSSGANWRQEPHHSGTGYSDCNDYNNKPSYKHGGKSDNYDDHYHKTETSSYGPAVNMISNLASSRARPSRTAHSSGSLPVRGDGRLSIPTDDMERALHYLRESAKTPQWPRK